MTETIWIVIISIALWFAIWFYFLLRYDAFMVPLIYKKQYNILVLWNKGWEEEKRAVYIGEAEDCFDYLEDLYLEIKTEIKADKEQYRKVKDMYFSFMEKKSLSKFKNSFEYWKYYFYVPSELTIYSNYDVRDVVKIK